MTADRRPKITGPLGHEGAPSGAPQPVRMRLLGSFSVSVGDRTVARGQWRLRKAVALVKLLAPGHRLHREQAMDLLRPELGTKAAFSSEL